MVFDTHSFLTGVFIALALAADSIAVGLIGKWMGFTIQMIGYYHGKLIKRRIKGTVWQIGYLPLGSFVKIRGLAREEDEAIHPGDFDQQSLGKQAALLLVDKVLLGLMLIISLIFLPVPFAKGFSQAWDIVVYIYSGSPGTLPFPEEFSFNVFFLLAIVSLWMLITALLPIAGNKTQILLLTLFGFYKKKPNKLVLTLGWVLGLVFTLYMGYCLYRFFGVAFSGVGLTVLVNAIGGLLLFGLVFGLLVDAFGRVAPEEE